MAMKIKPLDPTILPADLLARLVEERKEGVNEKGPTDHE